MTGGAKDLALGAIRCAMRGDAGFLPGRCYAGRDWGWRYSEGLTPVQGGGGAAECALAGEAEQKSDVGDRASGIIDIAQSQIAPAFIRQFLDVGAGGRQFALQRAAAHMQPLRDILGRRFA